MEALFEVERTAITSPRMFDLVTVGAVGACELNAMWHSRFPKIDWSNVVRNKHYVCFAAMFRSNPYAVAIWSTPIAANRLTNGWNMLELRRLAISPEAPKNTATWMLGQMCRDIRTRFPEVVKLISYQDTEVHAGTIYKAANWTRAAESQMDWNTGGRKRAAAQSSAVKVRWELEL